jgi:hypothetical protein
VEFSMRARHSWVRNTPCTTVALARCLASWATGNVAKLLEGAASDVHSADHWFAAKGVRVCWDHLGPFWFGGDWLR